MSTDAPEARDKETRVPAYEYAFYVYMLRTRY